MRGIATLSLFSSCILWGTSVAAITGPEIAEKVCTKLENLKTLTAHFDKSFHWKLANEVHKYKGKLYVQNPDKFRIETDKWLMCSDGRSVWTYSETNGQVLISRAAGSEGELTPQAFLFRYVRDYSAEYLKQEKLGRRTCYLLQLTPKEENSFVTQMKVWIDKNDGLTRKASYTDINGNITTYELSGIQVGKPIDDALFRFDPPEGVEVIDLRE